MILRRVLAPLLALVLCAALLAVATGAGATHTSIRRLGGEDAESAALALSQAAVADGDAAEVLLGRSDLFADLVASAGAQAAADAPLLLTPSDHLDEGVRAELGRLGARTVTILGGPGAVSEVVADELRADGFDVRRVRGASRVQTAVAIAEAYTPSTTRAVLVRADAPPGGDPTQAFADALAAGGLAAETGAAVLLTASDRLTEETGAHLVARGIRAVTVVGGPGAVSDAVLDDLRARGIEPERLSGTTRAGTAVAVAERRSVASMDVILVEGSAPLAYASAFPAALLARDVSAPILLASGDGLPPETQQDLEARGEVARLWCAPLVAAPACDAAARALGLDRPHGLEASEPFLNSEVTWTPPLGGDPVVMPVYVAHTPELRGRGLMFREGLPREAGMIFYWAEEEHRGGFFMKNTLIPLTIAFADRDGIVLRILDMEPCEADPCQVYDPGVSYRYAVEMNQGYDDEIGLTEGWQLTVPDDLPAGS